MDKSAVIKKYNLNRKQIDLINSYILKLTKSNQIHNLVGPSTIDVAWDRHINDSLQLSEFILKKKCINNRPWYWRWVTRGDLIYFWVFKYIID